MFWILVILGIVILGAGLYYKQRPLQVIGAVLLAVALLLLIVAHSDEVDKQTLGVLLQ